MAGVVGCGGADGVCGSIKMVLYNFIFFLILMLNLTLNRFNILI